MLDEFYDLNLKIYVGMVSQDGISEFTHLAFQHLVKRYVNRLEVYYQITKPVSIAMFTIGKVHLI